MHHNPPETLTSFSRSPPLIQTHTLSLSLSLSLSLYLSLSLSTILGFRTRSKLSHGDASRHGIISDPHPSRCRYSLSLSLSLFVLEKKLSVCELFRSVCDSLAFVFAGYTGTILVKNGKFSDLLGELQVFFFY